MVLERGVDGRGGGGEAQGRRVCSYDSAKQWIDAVAALGISFGSLGRSP